MERDAEVRTNHVPYQSSKDYEPYNVTLVTYANGALRIAVTARPAHLRRLNILIAFSYLLYVKIPTCLKLLES